MKIIGLIEREFVHTVIRKRPRDVHKGDLGRILIAAGSTGMAGAAVFAGKSAVKCGSGLVTICTKKKNFPVLQISVPETICIRWSDARKDLGRYDAVAVYPGMGVGSRTEKILETVLTEYDQTVVIDADGLNAVAQSSRLQELIRRGNSGRIIMTPHIGEAKRLMGKEAKENMTRLEMAEVLTAKFGCIVILKGPDTLVAISPEKAYTNTTGNPGMATAGSGDVLTGIIASLAGQGLSPEDAAKAGVFVHGLSGDLAACKCGEYGLTASDIADHVPFAIKELIEKTKECWT